ncbi:hypothetical protein LIER_35168 [Lithospermum erythrorhizon]|uniref:Uncharacterized protein n=1 Tax=Lithospermum erythrorhizon TaxID=34254 RepID=A0AAV3NKS4_LITER
MAEEDMENTAFIVRNMEIYVEEMLIKSQERDDHETNLRESFDNLRSISSGSIQTMCHVNGDFKIDEAKEKLVGTCGVSEAWPDFSDHVTWSTFPKREIKRWIGYPSWQPQGVTPPGSTMVEWVEDKAFRTKDIMDNALEGKGGRPKPCYQNIMEFLKTGVLPGDPPVPNKI